MNFQILSIVDNTVYSPGLQAEHGLSFYIEYNNNKILFDSGQGAAFRHNSEFLKIPFHKCNGFVFSHGHYDHTGNIDYILSKNPSIPIYLHKNALQPKFRKYGNDHYQYIGIPPKMIPMINSKKEIFYNENFIKIEEGVFLTGEIVRNTDFDHDLSCFYADQEGKALDEMKDDQSLYILTKDGIILVLGCCHSGLINTLEHVKKLSGDNRFLAVFGGTHLKNLPDKNIQLIIDKLKSFQINKMYFSHCSGTEIIYRIKKEAAIPSYHFTAGSRIQL